MSSATGRHQGFDKARPLIILEIWQAMKEDQNLLVMGEGAMLKASLDGDGILMRDFPDRIHTTGICEDATVNMAIGAALTGRRVLADVIFSDLLLRCLDSLLNRAAKANWMTGGRLHCPIVVKAEVGFYENAESGSRWDHIFDVPPPPTGLGGETLTVMRPRTVAEHVSQMHQALRSPGPVLYIEDRLVKE